MPFRPSSTCKTAWKAVPWVTKLPFPVHVVERIETDDQFSRHRLVSTYRYRHGYFDGVEREFRGFAMSSSATPRSSQR